MALQRLGRFDPTAHSTPRLFVKVHHGSDGDVVRHQLEHLDGEIRVTVTSDDERSYIDHWSRQFTVANALDESLLAEHPLLRRSARRLRGIRVLRMPWLFDCAASVVLQQRVRFRDAMIAFRRVAEKWGSRTDHGIAFPAASAIARLASHDLEAIGIDARRARTLILLAREEVFSRFLRTDDFEKLRKRLRSIPGVGPWTTEMILGFGAGDPDAVPVGDLHLPHLVCEALAGETPGSDERMLELLEPHRGQRFRIIRLLWASRFSTASWLD
jgi:3-methyladenine DNA glycosylase/8-oxoguanine DNA glycosylase